MSLHSKLIRYCAVYLVLMIAFSACVFSVSAITYTVGDVTGDGVINSVDALTVLRASAGLKTLSDEQMTCADVDGNGKVDSTDALQILRFSASLSSTLDASTGTDSDSNSNADSEFDTDEEALAYITEVVRLVNEERAAVGIESLVLDSSLCEASAIRVAEIQQLFDHTRPNGESFYTVLTELGLTYTACAENIAAGQISPEMVVNMWMNSTGHRANILNESYTKIGVGYSYAPNSTYTYYWEQLFSD